MLTLINRFRINSIYMNRKVNFVLVLILLMNTAFAQEVNSNNTINQPEKKIQSELYKNAVYFTLGYAGAYTFNGNYERMIWGNKHQVIRSLMIRVGVGKFRAPAVPVFFFFSSEFNLVTYLSTLGILLGRKDSFFEINMGAYYFDGEEIRTSWWSGNSWTREHHEFGPAVMMGYRYQKSGGHFVFRAGLGWPDLIYISLGGCF